MLPTLLLATLAAGPLHDLPRPPSVDAGGIRVSFVYRDARPEPLRSGDLILSRARIYQLHEKSSEIAIFDLARKSVHLVHVKLDVATEFPLADVETAVADVARPFREKVAATPADAPRADRIEAGIDRDLVDPRFRVEGTPTRLTLNNSSIAVEATGIPEPDAARRARVAEALMLSAKLRVLREPDTLPPFPLLDTLKALDDRGSRPTELAFLFRLAGPPLKFRWTFDLAPSLTPRESEALDRLDAILLKARRLPIERYRRVVDQTLPH